MRLLGTEVILATSDLTKFVRCAHATGLDHATTTGAIPKPPMLPASPMSELIAGKGDAHELAYVDELRAQGHEVVVIEKEPWSREAILRAEAATLEAMQHGARYIYQAAFFDGHWAGYADLLERIDTPSRLGHWSYEIIDTKLARAVKAHFLLQLADYSRHIERLQGATPQSMHIVLGTHERVSFRVGDFDAYYRHVRGSLERFIGGGSATAYPVEFCDLCDWRLHCWRHWNDVDHLSLVANITRTQVTRLERGEIRAMAALAAATPKLRIKKMAEETFSTLHEQARLQVQARNTGRHEFELLPLVKDRGFHRLPRPSNGDVFFDVEGDPFIGEGLTYLFGIHDGTEYHAWWAHNADEERAAFESVIDFLIAHRRDDPAAHIYHYGAMEAATLKRLMGRFGTREKEVDHLLRSEAFVDLAAVVRQGMRISHPSYGLKKIETFYFTRKSHAVSEAGGAVLAYERWLADPEDSLLHDIESYNREDCESIVKMRDWLVAIRPAGAQWKEPQQPRELAETRIEEDQKNDALFQTLAGLGLPLLGQLLYYHRREERPAWWWYFARQSMDAQELIEDGECIGALELAPDVAPRIDKKSKVFTYRYPPQEHKFDRGATPVDPATEESVGTIVSVDDATGTLCLKRGPSLFDAPHPTALMPGKPVDSWPLRTALQRFASSVAEQGVAATPYRAAADILQSAPPRLLIPGAMSDVLDATRRLDASYLFVQGPPGSGKTFTGARVIVDLLRAGKRIGVTSNSHAAIHNLLHKVEEVARAENYWFRGLKRGRDQRTAFTSKLPNPMIEATDSTADCANRSVQLVAGTAWLFADEKLDQSLDYLFIDEAGQVSLATALAACTAARNVVLLGDPLQLAQVSQATHPSGAGVSVLEHLLHPHSTVPADRGIFLGESWRMHPDVCRFVSRIVYDSRLQSAAECARQAVTIDGTVENGLRFMAVQHEGNSQASDEEAARISAEIQRMMRGTFTNANGVTAPLRPEDFLVVAAYNAQVRRIKRALTLASLGNVPVGTVDKFQGKEAPIVFFSLATSSGSELPRDLEFLFSRNRLNVAVSRARCLAILVASPRLLDVACKTPEQMRLVNGVCRFVEMAQA
jgi:predicted RecB family nuclease